jgi:hypothetical protein
MAGGLRLPELTKDQAPQPYSNGGVVPPYVETGRVLGKRLGLRPLDPARPVLRLSQFLTGAVPAHLPQVDYLNQVAAWGLYDNDKFGVCGPTAVANSRRLITQALTGVMQAPSQNDVFDLYKRSGNPDFDPRTGADDNGVEMATMLSAVQKGGIGGTHGLGGVRSVAYAKVDVDNIDECRAAIAIFGFLLLGVQLDTSQQSQPRVWDHRPSPVWGGHAVLSGAYTSATQGPDVSVISWANRIATTDAFWTSQVQEAWVCIWPEHLGTHAFQQGIDTDALNVAYMALTGKPGPFPHTKPAPDPTPTPAHPAPRPAPSPVEADVFLAQAFDAWRKTRGV